MIRGVHFDLDGTLVDSYEAITHALNRALDDLELPRKGLAEVRTMVGGGVHNVLVQAAGAAHAEQGVQRFMEHYREVVFDDTRLLPGATETLAELHRRGYRLGIATNKPSEFAGDLVRHLGLGDYVSEVLGPAEVEQPKPAPDMLLQLARRFDLPPSDCVYVGDMPLDAETARGAGMQVWLVPTGSSSLEEIRGAGPDRVLRDLNECLAHLPDLAA